MRIQRKVGAGVVAGSLLFAMSSAVPAFASTGPAAGPARVSGVGFARPANATSPGFGGWTFGFGANAAKSVTAEYKVPALKCTATLSGIAPLAGLLSGSTLSPLLNAAGVLLICQGGKPAAIAAVVVQGNETNDTTKAPHPGDLMKVTVVTSATKTTATVADLTPAHAFTFTSSGTGVTPVEEVIADYALSKGATPVPVVNFGTITYSSAAIGAKAIGVVTPRVAGNMETSAKVLQILTGPITGTAKNTFVTTFKHA